MALTGAQSQLPSVSKEDLALQLLVADGDPGAGDDPMAIAARESSSPQVLRLLASTAPTWATRSGLSVNKHTPVDVLDTLAAAFPHAAASNPSSSHEQLAKLATHPDSGVRAAVAKNPSAPPSVLSSLARSYGPYTLSNVAENPNIPREIWLDIPNTSGLRNPRIAELVPDLTAAEAAAAVALVPNWCGSLRDLFDTAKAACAREA